MDVPAATSQRLAVAAFVLVPVVAHLIIVKTGHVPLALVPHAASLAKLGFVISSALTHWAIYTTLLLTFALTLRPGHDPLICAMARRLHGPISAELERYTRGVTVYWTGVFTVQLLASILLFAFAPLVVWSFFVNILDIPLIATAFAAEYLLRLRILRDPPRHSFAMIVQMVADIKNRQENSAGLR